MKSCPNRSEQFKNFSVTFGDFKFGVHDKIQIMIRNQNPTPVQVDVMSRIQPAGVSVSTNAMPFSQVINRLQANPLQFTAIKVIATNTSQLQQPIQLVYQDAFGQMQQSTIIPEAYRSGFQTASNIVEITDIKGYLTTDSTIITTINGNTTVTFVLTAKQLFNNRKDFDNYRNFMKHRSGFKGFMALISKNKR